MSNCRPISRLEAARIYPALFSPWAAMQYGNYIPGVMQRQNFRRQRECGCRNDRATEVRINVLLKLAEHRLSTGERGAAIVLLKEALRLAETLY